MDTYVNGKIETGNHGLLINGRERPLISGSFHYWRSEPTKWKGAFRKIRSMGFEMVCTYIPWSVHEIEKGRFDFGQSDPAKNLARFIEEAAEQGLGVIARPGPHINSELTDFGYPWRVLKDPEIVARTNRGLWAGWHFPFPSYASEKFYAEAAVFFDELAPILAGLCHPYGPIIALQADNESGYFFSDNAPYCLDYHSDSIALYRSWLEHRYNGRIKELNRVYGSKHRKFASIEPPRSYPRGSRAKDLPPHLDWVAYKEYQISWSLNRIARMWKDRGIERIPIFHNTGFQHYPPCNNMATEAMPKIDFVGTDAYMKKEDAGVMEKTVLHLATTSRLPFVPEFGSGIWCTSFFDSPMLLEDDLAFQALYAAMKGMKAVNFYMLVDRDRWVGAPITNANRTRKRLFEIFVKFNRLMQRRKLYRFNRRPGDLILSSWDYLRTLNAARPLEIHKFGPLGLPATAFDPELPQELAAFTEIRIWQDKAAACLKRLGLSFDMGNSQLPLTRLIQYKRIYLASGGMLDERAASRLGAFVKNGGRLFVAPPVPALDSAAQPAPGFSWMKRHETPVETVRAQVGRIAGKEAFARPSGRIAEVEVHHGRGRKKAVFLANPSKRGIEATLRFHEPVRLEEITVHPAVNKGDGSAFAIELPPYTVKVFFACTVAAGPRKTRKTGVR